jgi:Zn-dependent protease
LERCAVCGAEEFIPYVCRYCGRTHCVLHRLPENHECPNIQQARAPRQPIILERRRTGTTLRLLQSPRMGVMPRRELIALTTAWIVLGISFSTRWMFLGWFTRPLEFLEVFLLTMLVIGTGFLGHELAHKFTAQRYGAWAEFRLWTIGAIMALVFAAIPPGTFVFAAPGAVYIASRSTYIGDAMDRKTNGIISLMGPLVNLAAAGIFGLVYVTLSAAGIRALVINGFSFLPWAIFINLWLGAFNMIPFFILDGQKVLNWNRAIWALITIPLWIATAAALILQLS